MKVLVTGAAGFIGFHLTQRLLAQGREVYGVDNLNPYYDVKLKTDRLARLKALDGFSFRKLDIADRAAVSRLFESEKFDRVVNLAAQAGVRHSLKKPHDYIDSNIRGSLNVLEGCRSTGVGHFVFASSSSVYGLNTRMPFSVHDNVDHPVSLYAATKKSSELIAHSYSHLFDLPTTGLRFFTVYGPWGRPDMALFLFVRAISQGKPIQIFNNGDMQRDFTYIDDIVEGVMRVLDHIPQPNPDWRGDDPDPGSSSAPYRLYNIGNNNPVKLMDFVEAIEEAVGKKAKKEFVPIQPGDISVSFADTAALQEAVGFKPATPIKEGISRFVDWYFEYFKDESI